MVMLGFAFSKRATSSTHSLCCTGIWAAGGAQLMLTVTLPPDEAEPPPDEPLEQAATARIRPAAAATPASGR
jgi:hypothetical protein